MGSTTRKLAEFVVQNTYDDLPEAVVSQAKRCLIDWMGVALAATKTQTVKILSALVRDLGGRKQATVIGSVYKTTVLNASLVNGAMGHVLDFDDTHTDAIIHTSAVLVPAALSGGEWKRRNGKELIAAFVMGFETATRVSFGAGRGVHQLELGWHPTSTIGRIGAAVCFGKLLGIDPQQMATAIGIAGTQAAGLKRVFGTMTKHFHPGKASHDGVLAALLASRGFSAPLDILEGEDGFCQVFSGRFDEREILDGLGERFEILNNSFKPYPSCHQTHAVISACLDISHKLSIHSYNIKEIICEVNPLAPETAGIRNPRDGSEAKFSLHYCAARALMGDISPSTFVPKEIAKEEVQQLMKCVEIRTNPSFSIANARVEVKTVDGKSVTAKIDGLKGGPSNPMTDDELDAKFVGLAFPVLKDNERTKKILHALHRLETLDDVSSLLSLLAHR